MVKDQEEKVQKPLDLPTICTKKSVLLCQLLAVLQYLQPSPIRGCRHLLI
jgi:hypothetical protein